MAYGDIYTTGTVDVTNGNTAVTGTGTLWAAGALPLQAGDSIVIQGRVSYIATVNSSTSITLASPFTGATGAGQSYTARLDSPKRYDGMAVAANVNRLVLRQMRLDSATGAYRVLGMNINPSPASPSDGDTYVVGPAPTGAWVGHVGQFATWSGTAWAFVIPEVGDQAFDQTTSTLYTKSTSAWAVNTPVFGRGGNQIENSDLTAGPARMRVVNGVSTSSGLVSSGGYGAYIPDGIEGMFQLYSGTSNAVFSWISPCLTANARFPVVPGGYYEASVYTVNRDCNDVQVQIQWYNSAGSAIGEVSANGTVSIGSIATPIVYTGGNSGANLKTGGKLLTDAFRCGLVAQAPATAVSATLRLIRSGSAVGVANSLAIYYRPYFGQGRVGQTELTAWAPGPQVVPPGLIEFFGSTVPPSGWLKCNGAQLSTTIYADLYSVIGLAFGSGSGTFAVPDLRAMFLRGLDEGRGADVGRVFASYQGHAVQDHYHVAGWSAASTGGSGSDPLGFLYGPRASTDGSGRWVAGVSSANTASETRPWNVALLPCIKY